MQLKFSLALSLSQVGLILSSPLVPSNDVILASIAMRDISLPIAKRVPVSALSKNSSRGLDAHISV